MIIVLCFVFRNMPVGVRAGMAAMSQIDRSLDEASLHPARPRARDAAPRVLPLLRPAIVGRAGLRLRARDDDGERRGVPGHRRIRDGHDLHHPARRSTATMASPSPTARVLIVLMLAVILLIQLAGRRAPPAASGAAPAPIAPGTRHERGRARASSSRDVRSATARWPPSRRVSFTVEPGTLVTLLGPSGCGKTTTLAHDRRPRDCRATGRILIGGARRHRRSARPSATSAWCSSPTRCSRT